MQNTSFLYIGGLSHCYPNVTVLDSTIVGGGHSLIAVPFSDFLITELLAVPVPQVSSKRAPILLSLQ